jgi:membrane peptidoglycan carboxypeptidase
MVALGKQMGITTWGDPSQYGLALTLGSGEVTMLDMATVYGTLANQGKHVSLSPILSITDSKGNTLEKKTAPNGTQVLKPGIAFILSDILADNIARSWAFGPNSTLHIPNHYVSVKTGTTDSKRDNWTDGYTSDFVVVVWVGNNDNTPMSQNLASGITGAAPIWHGIMQHLLETKPEAKPVPPPDIVRRFCSGKEEYFISGTENLSNCSTSPYPSRGFSKERLPEWKSFSQE